MDQKCEIDPGCGTALLCADGVYRCPIHAGEGGFCAYCGVAARGICPTCATLNGVEPTRHGDNNVTCNNCGEPIVWQGDPKDSPPCPECGSVE